MADRKDSAMVYLEEITRADVPVINEWRRRREIADRLGGPFRFVAVERDEAWFDEYMASRGTQVRLGIHVQKQVAPIGVVYLTGIDPIARNAEFSIMIGSDEFRGKGLGTEATRLALDHAFGDLNLERVYLFVLAGNDSAQRMYEAVGFAKEGTLRRATYKSGAYHDLVAMAILRDEWATQSS